MTARLRPLLLAALAGGIGMLVGRLSMARQAANDLWVAADDRAPATSARSLASRARAKADEVAASRRAGSQDARGRSDGSVGLDLGALKSVSDHLEPVVQYLTYIQSRRGQDSSLLFIRYDDIDAMAELDGGPSQELLERLDQLGVVISSN